jgi:hypothetical protein
MASISPTAVPAACTRPARIDPSRVTAESGPHLESRRLPPVRVSARPLSESIMSESGLWAATSGSAS